MLLYFILFSIIEILVFIIFLMFCVYVFCFHFVCLNVSIDFYFILVLCITKLK